MKWKMRAKIAIKFASSLAILSIGLSGNAFASKVSEQTSGSKASIKTQPALQQRHKHKKVFRLRKLNQSEKGWDLGEGWLLTSTGGLSYIHPNDESHWFKLSGVIRLDETLFMGSYRDKQPITGSTQGFPSGFNLRTADLYLDGGIGKHWEYTMSLQFIQSGASKFGFSDTWIAYSGFMDNNQLFIGRVPGNWFGLDNANSTSWNPFLERSIQTIAFYPGDGLGVMTDFWWDFGGFTITAMQPDQNGQGNATTDSIPGVRDRWKGTMRLTLTPVHEVGDVWHFGISGAYRELVSTVNGVASPSTTSSPGGVAFSTVPSARARNTASLLSTTTGNAGFSIRANNVRLFNVEAARQYGPFMLEGEYTNAFVHRIGGSLGTLRFEGWNVQTRYLLTGESHEYDVRDGSFSSVKPIESYGAFEVAARYDYLGLNDKDVRGGAEHDVTVGLNWFVNPQVRLSVNYIRASIHPANDTPKRDLDIVGMRAQVRFK